MAARAATAFASAKLRPPWSHLARAVWILALALGLVTYALSITRYVNLPLPNCTTPEAACLTWTYSQGDLQQAIALGLPIALLNLLAVGGALVAQLSLPSVGVIIFWRRSDDWVVLLLSTMLLSVLAESGNSTGIPLLDQAARVLVLTGTVAFALLPFIFPNGRFVPQWTRWLAVAVAVAAGVVTFAVGPSSTAMSLLSLVVLVVGGYAMIYRYYRVSNAVERQQTRWVVVGLFCSLLNVFVLMAGQFYPPAQPSAARVAFLGVNLVVYVASYLALAGCILVAVLRYRLWDIDLLINRALVYGVLTGALALVYYGSVVVLQNLFEALTNQDAQTPLAVVGSTLAIAALFAPLRRRLQDFIDRRFYRRKYDAEQTLASFSTVARDETDLDRLAGQLVGVVHDTLQPSQATLWLRPPPSGEGRLD